MGHDSSSKTRRDGWTAELQLSFLEVLAHTRSVVRAAAAVGMSREGAYRFRNRCDGSLFGALWDRILAPTAPSGEGHIDSLADGRLIRLLGNHYRRERGDFSNIGGKGRKRAAPDRTRT